MVLSKDILSKLKSKDLILFPNVFPIVALLLVELIWKESTAKVESIRFTEAPVSISAKTSRVCWLCVTLTLVNNRCPLAINVLWALTVKATKFAQQYISKVRENIDVNNWNDIIFIIFMLPLFNRYECLSLKTSEKGFLVWFDLFVIKYSCNTLFEVFIVIFCTMKIRIS